MQIKGKGLDMIMNLKNITVNTQSSIRIGGSAVLYFDPFQITGSAHDADVILITHDHYDHFDTESIMRVMKETTVLVGPVRMKDAISGIAGDREQHYMSPGETLRLGDVQVQAVPAYNKLKPFHPKGSKWLGYVVTMDDVSYYVAGDTDAVKELSAVSCDVALIPIGGKYTMDAKEAAKLVNTIRPKAAIPTHYGSIVGKKEDAETFRKLTDDSIIVETRL